VISITENEIKFSPWLFPASPAKPGTSMCIPLSQMQLPQSGDGPLESMDDENVMRSADNAEQLIASIGYHKNTKLEFGKWLEPCSLECASQQARGENSIESPAHLGKSFLPRPQGAMTLL
jgi:hypothetical protein